ncbi:MAG: hypothetical protein LBD03_01055 [Methanobrevibacter sp.]|jgi:hypothetical protein|nr:hypothetical protein [Candidatus Methanovirga procula]
MFKKCFSLILIGLILFCSINNVAAATTHIKLNNKGGWEFHELYTIKYVNGTTINSPLIVSLGGEDVHLDINDSEKVKSLTVKGICCCWVNEKFAEITLNVEGPRLSEFHDGIEFICGHCDSMKTYLQCYGFLVVNNHMDLMTYYAWITDEPTIVKDPWW